MSQCHRRTQGMFALPLTRRTSNEAVWNKMFKGCERSLIDTEFETVCRRTDWPLATIVISLYYNKSFAWMFKLFDWYIFHEYKIKSTTQNPVALACMCEIGFCTYSQLCLSRSRISRISPTCKSKVYTRHLSFIFYCFLPHISRIFSKSKLFLQSQEIRLRQSWLYIERFVKANSWEPKCTNHATSGHIHMAILSLVGKTHTHSH